MSAEASSSRTPSEGAAYLSTVEGETAFFRSLMRARPIGIHRHFHILTIQGAILKDTGRHVSAEDVWEKIHECYNVKPLEDAEPDAFDRFLMKDIWDESTNLARYPHFHREYEIPAEDAFISTLVSSRRISGVESPPASSPAPETKRGKADMAGLVGGDSDSSELTDSGDDVGMESPADDHESASAAETDSQYDGEEDVEMRELSAEPAVPKPKKARTRPPTTTKKSAPSGKTKVAPGTSARKKKRT